MCNNTVTKYPTTPQVCRASGEHTEISYVRQLKATTIRFGGCATLLNVSVWRIGLYSYSRRRIGTIEPTCVQYGERTRFETALIFIKFILFAGN